LNPLPVLGSALDLGEQVIADLNQLPETPEQLAFNPANTTAVAEGMNLSQWSEHLKNQLPEGSSLALLKVTPVVRERYPQLACLRSLEGFGSVGVLIDPAGEAVGKPTLLRSTGYQVLNHAALDHAAEQRLEATGQYQRWLMPFEFAYYPSRCALG